MDDGTLHRFRAHQTILATGGYGRAYFSCTSAHTCTGDGNAMVLRAGLPLAGHGVRAVPPDRHLRRRLPDHRRRARRGRLSSPIPRASASWSATRRSAKDLASRDVVSRAMTIEIREGRGVGPNKDHIHLHLDHLDPKMLHERLPGITEIGAHLRRRRRHPRADPGAADRALQHGRHPHQLSRRGADQADGDPDAIVPGLMALGEAACVSVHGANRLGSNSLIDLVVFGRAAALRCAETHHARSDKQPELPKDAGDEALAAARPLPLRQWRHADRGAARSRCRRPCRATAPCSAPARCCRRACKLIHEVLDGDRRHPRHRPLADLEHRPDRDARIRQSDRRRRWSPMDGALEPHGEPRRACARGLPRARRQELDEAHAVLGRYDTGKRHARLPPGAHLHARPTTSTYIEPKARVY